MDSTSIGIDNSSSTTSIKTQNYGITNSQSVYLNMTMISTVEADTSGGINGVAYTTTYIENNNIPENNSVRWGILPPLVILILFTFAANILVMVCVLVEQRLRKPTNMYVFSLAAADCIVGLCVMSSMAVYTLHGFWPLGQTLCSIWVVLDFVCCSISMFHLTLIAHDRYMALTRPLKYRHPRRAKYIGLLIFLAWFVGILVWVPAIATFRSIEEQVELDCYFFPNKYYILVQSIVVYFTPILVLVYFYIMCLYGLHSQYSKVQAMDNGTSKGLSKDMSIDLTSTLSVTEQTRVAPYSEDGTMEDIVNNGQTPVTLAVPGLNNKQTIAAHNKTKAEKRRQDHMRSIRTLGAIILAFLICWLPFCVFWPVSAFCETCIPAVVYEYSYWSAYINSTLNPLLYFLCNKDFRVAFKTICRKLKLIK